MDQDATGRELLRRTFLRLVGASGLAVLGSPFVGSSVLAGRSLTALTIEGRTALRAAMHVHTSFSEGAASLHSQLEEAARNSFDVFWPTDHDWRMSAYQAPTDFHFTGLSETVNGKKYTWTPGNSGSLASSSGGIVTTVLSPRDPAPGKGSLKVAARSSGSSPASRRYLMSGGAANQSQRTNLAGQTVSVDVFPDLVGQHAWAEVLVVMSYRPATAGRAGGSYTISYRIGTVAPSRRTEGLRGIVTILLPPKGFGTITLDPTADAAALWPDMVASDNCLVDLKLGVTSEAGMAARAYFGYLRFNRSKAAGDQPLQTQADMVQQYVDHYPGLSIGRGIEVSGPLEHANWFGGEQHLIQYETTAPPDLVAYAADLIHQRGGLASLNHPFGTSAALLAGQAAQDAQRRLTAQKFLDRQLCGVDIVETGYRQRGAMGLETHLALYDTFIRNGYWVTATGVNDNHAGTAGSWSREPNRFYSTIWAASRSEADLLAALRSGRVFVGEVGAFNGHLDISVEGNPMGSVSIRPGSGSRELTMTALDLPTGSQVEVVRGPVDYSNSLDPGTTVVQTLSATAFSGGQATTGIETGESCFVRLNLVDAVGRRIAFTNPVMLLQSEPSRPLPDWRRAPDSVLASESPSPSPSPDVSP